MFDDPLDMVYSLVERSYLRLQAAELLATCLESGEIAPLEELVEGLVLVGPQSLGALREILSEVDERKVQIQHDIDQVLQELAAKLKEYGATFESQEGLAQLTHLDPATLLLVLDQKGITAEANQRACLQLFQDALEITGSMEVHKQLMSDLASYLQDWFWGLVYQSVQNEISEAILADSESKWLQ